MFIKEIPLEKLKLKNSKKNIFAPKTIQIIENTLKA